MKTEYISKVEEKDINWFIDTVLVNDIKSVIDSGGGYLACALMAQAIEVLGALLDEQDFNDSGLSEGRFNAALKKLFPSQYHSFSNSNSPYYFYEHLRCGMAHVLRPQSRIAFSSLKHAEALGLKNLDKLGSSSESEQILLVVEDLHADLKEACRRAKNRIKKKTNPKLKAAYLMISRYYPKTAAQATENTFSCGETYSPEISSINLPDLTITGKAPEAR